MSMKKKNNKNRRGKGVRNNVYLGEVRSHQIKEYNKDICLYPSSPTCQSESIDAHTLQRNGTLSRIKDCTGHVSSFYQSSFDLSSRKLKMRKVGWYQASTFRGFCGDHDNDIFAPLEKTKFSGTPEQCFLVGYRAICHELYQKMAAKRVSEYSIGKNINETPEVYRTEQQMMFELQKIGIEKGLEDTKLIKKIYDDCYIVKNFDELNYVIVKFKGKLSLSSTGVISPDFDLSGSPIQDLTVLDTVIQRFMIGILATEDENGVVVMSWPHSFEICTKYIMQILQLDKKHIPDMIVELSFAYIENTFFQTSWWNALSNEQQSRIHLLTIFTHCNQFLPLLSLNYVEWDIYDIIKCIKRV